MKDFFTSLSIWTGAIVAILTIVDWLLTESQKKSVSGWAEYAWLWLDDQKMERFVNLLKSHKIQLVLSVITYISMYLLFYRIFHGFRGESLSPPRLLLGALVLLVIVAFISWTIHSRVIIWAVNSHSLEVFFIRCLYVWLISLAATFLLLIVGLIFQPERSLVFIPFVLLYLIPSTELG